MIWIVLFAVALLIVAAVVWVAQRLFFSREDVIYVPRLDSEGRVEGTPGYDPDPILNGQRLWGEARAQAQERIDKMRQDLVEYDNGVEEALKNLNLPGFIDDHTFDGGWHNRAQCQYIYEGASDFTQDTVCGEPKDAHAAEAVPELDDVEDEDDQCPGHRTVLGGLVSCDLPFGHRGVTGEPYNVDEDGGIRGSDTDPEDEVRIDEALTFPETGDDNDAWTDSQGVKHPFAAPAVEGTFWSCPSCRFTVDTQFSRHPNSAYEIGREHFELHPSHKPEQHSG